MSNELKYTILGMMSGTSLDGLDLSLCQFNYKNCKWDYKILESKTIAYSIQEKDWLQSLEKGSKAELNSGDISFGKYLGEKAKEFITTSSFNPPDAIASHGHTIFHKPEVGITFQAGRGNEIANATGIKTICDFRQKDVSLGGQGAPLVPIGDLLLFNDSKCCLNLGGFANVSVKSGNGITAFDICPVNYVLNFLSKKEGFDFDESGDMSRSGIIDRELLNQLNEISFYQSQPPKSLSREWVEEIIYPILKKNNSSTIDQMSTFTEHIAFQISRNLVPNEKTLVTGGGAYNTFLIELISDKTSNEILIGSAELIEFKEAMIFAFLGALYLSRQNNCLASVTGAKRDSIGGIQLYPNQLIK